MLIILVFFYLKVYIIFLLGLNLIIWLLSWLISTSINQKLIIFHYNIIFGIDRLSAPTSIYWLALIGSIWTIINLIFSFFTYKNNRLLAHLFLGTAVFGHLLLGLALYSIYLVNFVNINL